MTQYVTVNFGGNTRKAKRSVYTYRNPGSPVSSGSKVWVKDRNGEPRPVEVVHTSQNLKKNPPPDKWSGRAKKILRT